MRPVLRDPLREAERLEDLVTKRRGNQLLRAYFMVGRDETYTRGAVMAGMAGCNLTCIYCMWPPGHVKPRRIREDAFLSPGQAAAKIRVEAGGGIPEPRISGGEPTIGWEHTRELLGLLAEAGMKPVLETNGILVAARPEIASDLARLKDVRVRVSIKAATPSMFEILTRAPSRYFDYPFRALERLVEAGVSPARIIPAIMISFEDPRVVAGLAEKLASIDEALIRNVEPEILVLYPDTLRRLMRHGRRLRPAPFTYPWDEEDAS